MPDKLFQNGIIKNFQYQDTQKKKKTNSKQMPNMIWTIFFVYIIILFIKIISKLELEYI